MSHHPEDLVLNKYRLVHPLGKGRAVETWHALEVGFDARPVVIRLPLANAPADAAAEWQRRCDRELQVCRALEGAGATQIVRVLTLEPTAGGQALVTEFLPGGDLAALMRSAPAGVPVVQAVDLTRQVLSTLRIAHEHPWEIVHRNLKPTNILLDAAGSACVDDWGYAQLAGASQRTRLQAQAHPGTPGYMAPEQANSTQPLTPAADVYAVGCILFELLAGRPRHQNPGADLPCLRPGLPPALTALVAKALADNPYDRFTDAGEMVDALQQITAEPAPPPAARRSAGRWITAGLVAAVILLGAAIMWVQTPHQSAQPAQPAPAAAKQDPTIPAIALAADSPTPPADTATPAAAPGESTAIAPLPATATSTPEATATETAPAAATATLPPSATPTVVPTDTPTPLPTATETAVPTETPTLAPSATPTRAPTETPTPLPTATPTPLPTDTPSPIPTATVDAGATAAAVTQQAAAVAATLTALAPTITPTPSATSTATPPSTPTPTATHDLAATETAEAVLLAAAVAATQTALAPTSTPPAADTPTPLVNADATAAADARSMAAAVAAALTSVAPTPDLAATAAARTTAMYRSLIATATASAPTDTPTPPPTDSPTRRPTDTPTPRPRRTLRPTHTPYPTPIVYPTDTPRRVNASLFFRTSVAVRCDNSTKVWFEGMVTINGQPVNGYRVVFKSTKVPGNEPATNPAITGPQQEYPGWANGYYWHTVDASAPMAKDKSLEIWIMDSGGKRISDYAYWQTDGATGGCNYARIDFFAP